MWLVKDRDLSVLCTVLSQVLEFIEQSGIFRLSERTPVAFMVGYLAMCLMMMMN